MDNYTQHHHEESAGETNKQTEKNKQTNKQPKQPDKQTDSLHNYQMCLLLFKTELLKFSWDPT